MCGSGLISIIIPVFNVRPYLEKALESVIRQTYSHLEIIVIDDGSTDGSGVICDEFAKRDERIKVIHQENRGLSSARNAGLDIMTGEAVAFLDPDDIEWTEGTTVRSEGLILFNRSGEEVDSTLLEISYDNVKLDSVVLEMNILPTRTYETLELIDTINQVKKGYEVKAIHISPESITVAARGEVLNQMAELALSEHYVDLKGLSDTTSFQIKVSKPSDDAVLSNDTITVTVDIGPIEAEETSGQK